MDDDDDEERGGVVAARARARDVGGGRWAVSGGGVHASTLDVSQSITRGRTRRVDPFVTCAARCRRWLIDVLRVAM